MWPRRPGCSHSGMVLTGTNAPGAKTSGARTGNEAAWAGSGSPTASPTAANVRDIAFPDSSTSSPLARDAGAGPPSGGEPDGHHDDGDEHVLRQIRERPAAARPAATSAAPGSARSARCGHRWPCRSLWRWSQTPPSARRCPGIR